MQYEKYATFKKALKSCHRTISEYFWSANKQNSPVLFYCFQLLHKTEKKLHLYFLNTNNCIKIENRLASVKIAQKDKYKSLKYMFKNN